jgi:hypothetical protein
VPAREGLEHRFRIARNLVAALADARDSAHKPGFCTGVLVGMGAEGLIPNSDLRPLFPMLLPLRLSLSFTLVAASGSKPQLISGISQPDLVSDCFCTAFRLISNMPISRKRSGKSFWRDSKCYKTCLGVFQLKSYPIEIPPVGRNDITPVMLSAAKRSRNIPHSDWTIIFPDYSCYFGSFPIAPETASPQRRTRMRLPGG